jgi:hypothetical protein
MRTEEESPANTYVLSRWQTADWQIWGALLGWLFVHKLGAIAEPLNGESNAAAISRSWLDEWLFGKWLVGALQDLGVDDAGCTQVIATVKMLLTNQVVEDVNAGQPVTLIIRRMLRNPDIQSFIKLNRYQGVLWFNKEAFESLLWWVMFIAVIEEKSSDFTVSQLPVYKVIQQLSAAKDASEYRIDRLLEVLQPSGQ